MGLYVASVMVWRELEDGEIDIGHCPVIVQACNLLDADLLVTLRAGVMFPHAEGWGAPNISFYELDAQFVDGEWCLADLWSCVDDR